MGYLNGPIGCALVLLALAQLAMPGVRYLHMGMFLCGGALAFITLVPGIGQWAARFLAVCATATMFFYFACFIEMAPRLRDAWWSMNLHSLCSLIGAFSMIPVLSEYSCLMKAECAKTLETGRAKGFFSVP